MGNTSLATAIHQDEFQADVVQGLTSPKKHLPSKYFYDRRGSKLFDQICHLDEYYLTRSELEIINTHCGEIGRCLDRGVRLVEYGSGSSVKTKLLLDNLVTAAAYAPVDISRAHLLETANELQKRYPHIEITPVVADFTKPFELPSPKIAPTHDAVFFPGSTIGNFESGDALQILEQISGLVGLDGGLLIGIDLHKDASVVEPAYNDAQGITAEFNKNLLVRINRELNSNFDLDQFRHCSQYDVRRKRIESSLVSKIDQSVMVDDTEIEFRAGESIHTEYSHKYSIEEFKDFASEAGFELHQVWTDSRDYFAILHLVVIDEFLSTNDDEMFPGEPDIE